MGSPLLDFKTGCAARRSCFDGVMTLRPPAILLTVLAAVLLLGAQAPSKNEPDRQFQECPECPQMVAIPAGKFLMGSPAHEAGRFDSEGPQHAVTVKALALGKY